MRLSNGLYAFTLLALTILGGCASFPQHQVPTASAISAISATKQLNKKPSVIINVTHYMGENPGTEMRAASDLLRPVITSAILDSGLVDPTPYILGDKTDLQLNVTINNVGSKGAAMASGFITGLTLGIIPGVATDNYKVKIKVIDPNGTVLSTNTNQDAIRTWIGWIFLPFIGNSPEKAVKSTIANQVRAALNEAYEAGQLKSSSSLTVQTKP